MEQQIELFDLPTPPRPRYSVFLAALPDPFTARQIHAQGIRIQQKAGVRGSMRPLSHLHISLHSLGGYSEVPPNAASFVDHVCGSAISAMPAFQVGFNTVLSFRGAKDGRPLVLINRGEDNAALTRLHQTLGLELSRHLRLHRSLKFNPHVTFSYVHQTVPEEAIDPIGWKVDEVVLICSEVGATKYRRLGSWKLGN